MIFVVEEVWIVQWLKDPYYWNHVCMTVIVDMIWCHYDNTMIRCDITWHCCCCCCVLCEVSLLTEITAAVAISDCAAISIALTAGDGGSQHNTRISPGFLAPLLPPPSSLLTPTSITIINFLLFLISNTESYRYSGYYGVGGWGWHCIWQPSSEEREQHTSPPH